MTQAPLTDLKPTALQKGRLDEPLMEHERCCLLRDSGIIGGTTRSSPIATPATSPTPLRNTLHLTSRTRPPTSFGTAFLSTATRFPSEHWCGTCPRASEKKENRVAASSRNLTLGRKRAFSWATTFLQEENGKVTTVCWTSRHVQKQKVPTT